MRNWKANRWLTALALLLTPCILSGEPQLASAMPGTTAQDDAAAGSPAGTEPALTERIATQAEVATAAAADELPPGAVGSLTLQWTLSGRREALDCGGLGIDRFQVSLAANGGDAEPWDAPCDAFQISIDLPSGTYAGDALMLDRLDRPVTLNVPVEQVEVVAGRDVTKTINFPMAAFL